MSSLARPATLFAPLTAQRVDARRLLWVAPLTVLAALLANSIVQSLAHSLFPVTRAFSHLMVGAVALTTVGAVGAACLVFAVVARQARRPIWLYRRVAVVALVVTLILDVVLVLFTPSDPSYSTAGIVSLMVMHVVDAASYVGLLTTLPRIGTARGGPGRDEWVSTQGGA
jgi:amino acid transporter